MGTVDGVCRSSSDVAGENPGIQPTQRYWKEIADSNASRIRHRSFTRVWILLLLNDTECDPHSLLFRLSRGGRAITLSESLSNLHGCFHWIRIISLPSCSMVFMTATVIGRPNKNGYQRLTVPVNGMPSVNHHGIDGKEKLWFDWLLLDADEEGEE